MFLGEKLNQIYEEYEMLANMLASNLLIARMTKAKILRTLTSWTRINFNGTML